MMLIKHRRHKKKVLIEKAKTWRNDSQFHTLNGEKEVGGWLKSVSFKTELQVE